MLQHKQGEKGQVLEGSMTTIGADNREYKSERRNRQRGNTSVLLKAFHDNNEEQFLEEPVQQHEYILATAKNKNTPALAVAVASDNGSIHHAPQHHQNHHDFDLPQGKGTTAVNFTLHYGTTRVGTAELGSGKTPLKQLCEDHKFNKSSIYAPISTNTQTEFMPPSLEIIIASHGIKQRQQELDVRCGTESTEATNESLFLRPYGSCEQPILYPAGQMDKQEVHQETEHSTGSNSCRSHANKNHQGRPNHPYNHDQEKQQSYTYYGLACLAESNDHLPRPFHPAVGRPMNLMLSNEETSFKAGYNAAPVVVRKVANNGKHGVYHVTTTLPSTNSTMTLEAKLSLAMKASYQQVAGASRHASSSSPIPLANMNVNAPNDDPFLHISSFSIPSTPRLESVNQGTVASLSDAALLARHAHPEHQKFFLPWGHQQDFVDWQVTGSGESGPRLMTSKTKADVALLPSSDDTNLSFLPTLDTPISDEQPCFMPRSPSAWEMRQGMATLDEKENEVNPASQQVTIGNTSLRPVKPLSAYNFFYAELRDWILCLSDTEREQFVPHEQVVGSDNSFGPCSSQHGLLGIGMVIDQSRRYSHEERKRQLLSNHWNKDRTTRRKHRSNHGKISFHRMNSLVSSEWNTLPLDEKAFYKDVADTDKKRYKEQMEEWTG